MVFGGKYTKIFKNPHYTMIFAGMRSIGGKGNSDVAHPRNWCWIP